MLKNKQIYLRAIEPADIDLLFEWENNSGIWSVSNTITPFSKYILQQYIENSNSDIFTTKQVRFVICEINSDKPVGLIDMFDFDPIHGRAGIGIMIYDKNDRTKGFAYEAIEVLKNYSSKILRLNQLFCNIACDNNVSIKLFEKCGFKITGKKEKWINTADGFKDEYFLQFIFE